MTAVNRTSKWCKVATHRTDSLYQACTPKFVKGGMINPCALARATKLCNTCDEATLILALHGKWSSSKKRKPTLSFLMYVCVFMALVTTLVLCARSQDLVMSVSVRRVHVVFSTAGLKGGGKSCLKTRETAVLKVLGELA